MTAQTVTATAMKTWKTNGILLINRQIMILLDKFHQVMSGCHGLWPSKRATFYATLLQFPGYMLAHTLLAKPQEQKSFNRS